MLIDVRLARLTNAVDLYKALAAAGRLPAGKAPRRSAHAYVAVCDGDATLSQEGGIR
jgi:hypothetical protein